MRILAASALSLLPISSAAAQAPWTFVDETATRIVADPAASSIYSLPALGALGSADESEADVIARDFDRDGKRDMVVVRKAPQYALGQRVAVLFMNENGQLVDRTVSHARQFFDFPSSARDVAACDVNGDGFFDLIIGNTSGEDPILYKNRGLDPVTGAWRGFRHVPLWFRTEMNNTSFNDDGPGDTGMYCCAVACADVDGDGDVDLYIANYPQGQLSSRDRLLINTGNGVFFEETSARLNANWTEGISTGAELVDVDNDGDRDLTLTIALGGYTVTYNNGLGVFLGPRTAIPGANSHYMHTMVDINRDGRPDSYAVGDLEDRSSINQGVSGPVVAWGAGVFPTSTEVTGLGGNVHAFDLNDDGTQDIGVADVDTVGLPSLAACSDGHRFVLLENIYDSNAPATAPHFSDPDEGTPQPWLVDGVWDFAAIHLDDDGKRDLVLFHCGGVSVFMQQ